LLCGERVFDIACDRLLAEVGRHGADACAVRFEHFARAIAHPGSRTRDNEPEQINAIGERCWRRACEMLETHRTRISAMATHLRKETVARNVEYTFTAEQLDAWWSMTGTSSISAR
jgi:hypothetical protein